jgi:hypothetical protein
MAKDYGRKKYSGFERRMYFRYKLIYSPRRAILTIEGQDYKVLDMSTEGLRFVADTDMPSGKDIRGVLTFSDGESMVIEGTVVWMQEDEIGVKLKHSP